MKENDTKNEIFTILRDRALAKLNGDSIKSTNKSSKEFKQLLHELQTYHIELEMQNEELRRSQSELIEANSTINNLYDYAPIGYLTINDQGKVLKCNLTLSQMFGVERSTLIGSYLSNYVHTDHVDNFHRELRAVTQPGFRHSCELKFLSKTCPLTGNLTPVMGKDDSDNAQDGYFWGQMDSVPVDIELGNIESEPTKAAQLQYRIVLLDISERKRNDDLVQAHQQEQTQLIKEISHQATHDGLTGLVNRGEFEVRLNKTLHQIQFSTTHIEHALCYLDLDQFKVVNDSCGHIAGDALLRQLSHEMSEAVRQRDTLARLGGDEFAILMEHCSLDDAIRLAEDLRELVEKFQFSWDSQTFKLSVSIGLISIDSEEIGLTELLKRADAACYLAKERGRNRIHIYKDSDEAIAKRFNDMKWVSRIQSALKENRFVLFAQTIEAIDDSGNGDGGKRFELLVRMIENDVIIPPGAFLGAAERFNLAPQIDTWVITHLFKQLNQFPEFLLKMRMCNINLSGSSITEKSFLNNLLTQFDESNIDPSKICFEITETAVISNMSLATQFILKLKEKGCKFALDDFGIGLSSFAYLKKLPVDYLKIDGLFVRGVVDDPIDLATVKSINDLGHIMGKKTIAEYVENDSILKALQKIGVNYAQGKRMGMPQPTLDLLAS